MYSDLTTALSVSGVGLLMLFVALAVLYGLIYAMTAFIKDQPSAEVKEPPPRADKRPSDVEARVAVLAVALARAELESSPANPPEAEAGISPWEQYHRHRRLSLNLRTRTIQ